MDTLPSKLAAASVVDISGIWQRHVAARYANSALHGRAANARWGTDNGFPVLYLGKPTESVVVEAYRHLVDPVVDGRPETRPRILITCDVSVTNILDLRLPTNRVLAGLNPQVMLSSTDDRASYAACQNVSAAAHQLGFHGLIAPAATNMGETLVLFTDLLPEIEKPTRTSEETWIELPPDPRSPGQQGRLHVVR